MIGTGPFRLVDWRPGDRQILERFEEYTWGPADIYDNTGPAQFARIEYRTIPEETTQIEEMLAGGYELHQRLPFSAVDRLAMSDIVDYHVATPAAVEYINFRCDRPPFDEVALRRAFAHGVNKEEIVAVATEGICEVAHSWLREGVFGWTSEMAQYSPEYDPDKAAQILDEAGWDTFDNDGIRMRNGERLEFTYSVFDTELRLTAAELIQAQLREIGMDLRINSMETAAMFEHIRAGEHSVFPIGGGMQPAGADQLRRRHHPDFLPNPNYYYYSNDRLTELLEFQFVTPDQDARLEAILEIEKILMQDAVWIPIYYINRIRASNHRIVNPGMDHPTFDGHYKLLDTKLRAE